MGAQPAQRNVVMPAPPGAAVTFQSTIPETDYETAQRRIAEGKAQTGEALGRLQTVFGTPIDIRDRLAERELSSAGAYLSSLPRGDKYISAERYQPAIEAATRRYANLKTLTPEPAESAISGLYQNILNRLPDLKGFQYWSQEDPRARGGINKEEKSELTDIFKKVKADEESARVQAPRRQQISELYTSVLGREADEPGLKYWSESTLDIPGVKRQLEISSEKRQQQIKSLYKNILGREADTEGLQYWSDKDPRAQEGFTPQELEEISADFRRSPEYQKKMASAQAPSPAPSTSPAAPSRDEQIKSLYKNVLGREADTEGLKYWSQSGQNIGEIESNIRRSSEYQSKAPAQSRDEQIKSLYKNVLGREADPEGLKYWSQSGQDVGEIEANIRRSAEYQKRA